MKLHFLDWGGEGASLVLLHGGSAHACWWDFVAPRLTERFRVYALDLRGHGESEWSLEGAYGIDDHVADLEAWLPTVSPEPPVLVGHSLGSFVALRYAIRHPRGLAGLVVVDGRAAYGRGGSRYMKLLRMLAPGEYASLEEAVERFRPLPAETSARPEVLAHVARESFREDEPDRWVAKFDRAVLGAHEPFDYRDALGTLEFPVLFVRGSESRVLGREAAGRLAASCRRGEWAEIPGAHHHVPLDRPEELSAVILGFFDRVQPAGACYPRKHRGHR